LFYKEHADHEAKRADWQAQVDKIANISLVDLRKNIDCFCLIETNSSTAKKNYRQYSEQILRVRAEIEALQKLIRNAQRQVKLPIKLIAKRDNDRLHTQYQLLSENFITLSRQLHTLFLSLSQSNQKDGLIHALNNKWHSLSGQQPDANDEKDDTKQQEEQPEKKEPQTEPEREVKPEQPPVPAFNIAACNDEELVFVDEDLSVGLYEAVKTLGNPSTFGDIYKVTWEDIIKCGFRKESDFTEKNIRNLKDLETYITNYIKNRAK